MPHAPVPTPWRTCASEPAPIEGCTCARTGAPRRCRPRRAAARCRPRTRRSRPGGGAASPGPGSCACGRTGAGGRRAPPCSRIAAIVSANDIPRGISSLRKSPITSPCASVLTSSPGITISARPRASSTASSAPPKTLWSVTAIAPRPFSSAWSSRSVDVDRAVVRPAVCRWRSARIHGAVGERVASRLGRAPARGRRRVEPVELALRRRRSSGARRPRRACALLALAELGVLGEPRDRGRGELRLLVDAGGRRSPRRPPPPRAAARRALRAPGRRSPPRSGARRATRRRGASGPTRGRASEPRDVRPPERASSASEKRAPSPSARAAPEARRGRAAGPRHATRATISGASPRAGSARCRRPRTTTRSRPGSARAAAARTRLARGEERVDPREQRSRCAFPAGTRAAPREERRDARVSARRAGRGTRGSAARARTRARRRSGPRAARARGSSRTPTGTPMLRAREIGTAGPSAITSASAPLCSARLPAASSRRARFEGASTVTWWPARAAPRRSRRRAR